MFWFTLAQFVYNEILFSMNNSKFVTGLLFFLLLSFSAVLYSCKTSGSASTTPVYNDTLNQQLWSADWAPGDTMLATGGVDSVLRIFYSQNLELYKSFNVNSWIHVVKWHPDGKLVAVATLDRYIMLVDTETGVVKQLDHPGGARAMGWNHNGQLLAVGDLDGDVQIWDKQGRLQRTIKNQYEPGTAGTCFLSLDWHPTEDNFVAVNFEITRFDTSGATINVMQHVNKKAIMLSVKWHPSAKFFVVGDYGYNWEGEHVPSLLHFWTADGTLIRSVPGSKAEYRNISWNNNGRLLATASDVLRIWNADGQLLHQGRPDGTNYLWGIQWNNKGDKIVTSSRHKTVAVWDSSAILLKRMDL